jgi:hypothetical protein
MYRNYRAVQTIVGEIGFDRISDYHRRRFRVSACRNETRYRNQRLGVTVMNTRSRFSTPFVSVDEGLDKAA